MISKFIRNFSLIFFAITAFNSFCIDKDFSNCDLSEEKILTMSNEEIMGNYTQCMKNKDNNIDEKQRLTKKLEFIEEDSKFNIILQKMGPFYIGGSVVIFLASTYLFYSSDRSMRTRRNIAGIFAGGSFLSIGLFWKLNQYQNNRMTSLKESRKKIAAPDIKKIFENMKNNNNRNSNREL